MAQKTAVEWLIEEIKNFDSGRSEYYSKVAIYNHAFRMEKEQIINAHNHGEYFSQFRQDGLDDVHGIEYYNETYNK